MLRSQLLVLAALFVSSIYAADYWPSNLGGYPRQGTQIVLLQADAQMSELGFEGLDRAEYGSKFLVTAWRFRDPTGAYAASLQLSAIRVGNYLVQCEGMCPKDLPQLADAALPRVSHGSPPTLADYLPPRNRIPRSERYILGPVGLKTNAPEIPASAASFEFGTEAALARYGTSPAQATLGIFSYPTPAIARQQTPKFQSISGATVKRTGSLVAVVLGPSEVAPKLLSEINYSATVSINETPPLVLKPETAGQMLVAIINLAGFVLAFCVVSGLLVGGILYLSRRFGYSGADGTLITLHLSRK